jgi:alpha-mannosidase
MTIRRASILLPCDRLENLPTHLGSNEAAELLAAWTGLWHPAITAATGRLPGWHSADDPPDPGEMEAELIVIPSVSRHRLAGDWCERVRGTSPTNPEPVAAAVSRADTIAALLQAAGIAPDAIAEDVAAAFLALGYAHLQVELLTRAMRYSTVLDTEQFTSAVVAASVAASCGDNAQVDQELGRAFDLLADARSHVYSVDFYVVDVALLAPATLGESLRAKLQRTSPCNLLASGELIEQMAREHPDTLWALRAAIESETACVLGGPFSCSVSGTESPEALLASLEQTQRSAAHHLGRECQIFGQFTAAFSPLLPEILKGLGFRAALHAAFDGGRLPRADQCKTRWGQSDGAWIEALSATPLDAARPETWLKFAEHVGDSIAHEHVATVLIATWPDASCEYFDDLCRVARFNPVLGKLVTLEEYFRISRETDDWTTFAPREYPLQVAAGDAVDRVSSRVNTYRREVRDAFQHLSSSVASIARAASSEAAREDTHSTVVLNPWSFSAIAIPGTDLIGSPIHSLTETVAPAPVILCDVPGCGFAALQPAPEEKILLAAGHKLQNELLELTVSPATGGIQSLRTHRDRSTRVSQRLVYHKHRPGRNTPTLDTKMVADNIEITRNGGVLGEITASGRLLDSVDQLLAHYTQTVRLARSLPAAIVDVELKPEQARDGDLWLNYFASRLAWSNEAVTFRRGLQWQARDTSRERIESPEFVEISNGVGNIVCFGMGLPFHRRPATTWLDTLLHATAQSQFRFQFSLGLDCMYPTQTALALLTANDGPNVRFPAELQHPRGWFLHLGARNLLITHLELLAGEPGGIRCRILETEGREVETDLSAYRPFRSAHTTDFRNNDNGVLSIVDGQVRFHIGPHRWIQIEAQW